MIKDQLKLALSCAQSQPNIYWLYIQAGDRAPAQNVEVEVQLKLSQF